MKQIRLSILLIIALLCSLTTKGAENEKLNVIFILADDLGWTDLSCYGSKFYETPNLDKLAQQGMKFTQAYSACCVCSPTRAAIITGKYPAAIKLTDYIAGEKHPFAKLLVPDWTKHLPDGAVTIAQKLKEAGYVTGSIGKWHLGNEEYYPEKVGFDVNVGGSNQGHPPSYFSPYKLSRLPDGPKGEYLVDRQTAEAISFVEKNKDRSFFLYMPQYAVHTPIQAKPEVIAKYEKKAKPEGGQNDPAYAALVEAMDESVGKLMQKLDELKLTDKTVVFFTSDNGGLAWKTSNAPLRDGKATVYEGGVRVPLIVRWPGQIKPQSQCNVPVISMDYFSTISEIAGASINTNEVHGESIVPLLKETGKLKPRTLYWHYPHYHKAGATPHGVVLDGDYRLIQFYETGRFELYNIKDDIGEKTNLVSKMPAKVGELNKKLDLWRKTVAAQMPEPNPNFDPVKAAEGMKRK